MQCLPTWMKEAVVDVCGCVQASNTYTHIILYYYIFTHLLISPLKMFHAYDAFVFYVTWCYTILMYCMCVMQSSFIFFHKYFLHCISIASSCKQSSAKKWTLPSCNQRSWIYHKLISLHSVRIKVYPWETDLTGARTWSVVWRQLDQNFLFCLFVCLLMFSVHFFPDLASF